MKERKTNDEERERNDKKKINEEKTNEKERKLILCLQDEAKTHLF